MEMGAEINGKLIHEPRAGKTTQEKSEASAEAMAETAP
jgi:hypothetical protein